MDEANKMLSKVKSIEGNIVALKYQLYLKEVTELNELKAFLARKRKGLDREAKQKLVNIILDKEEELKRTEKMFVL